MTVKRKTVTDDDLRRLVAWEASYPLNRWEPGREAREVARLLKMPQAERRLRAMMAGKARLPFDFNLLARPLMVTPYLGAYGTAGFAIVIEGTPPPATLIVQTDSADLRCPPSLSGAALVLIAGRRGRSLCRRYGQPDETALAIVADYLTEAGHLTGREGA